MFSLIAGFIPGVIIQSTNVRMYAFSIFLVSISFIMLTEYMLFPKKSTLVIATVLSVLTVYSHTFSTFSMIIIFWEFIIISIVLYRKALKGIIISGLITGISFIPWVIVLFNQFMKKIDSKQSHVVLSKESVILFFKEWFSSFGFVHVKTIYALSVFVLFGLIFAVCFLIKEKNSILIVPVSLSAIIILIITLCSVFGPDMFMGRYAIMTVMPLCIAVSVGYDVAVELVIKPLKPCLLVLISLIMIYSAVSCFRDEFLIEKTDGLNAYLEFVDSMYEDGDVIMANIQHYALFKLYDMEKPYFVYGYIDDNAFPFPDVTAFTSWDQIGDCERIFVISNGAANSVNFGEKYTLAENLPFTYSTENLRVWVYEKDNIH